MESYYIFIVGVLFVLAVSDLIVGVSNDAVNFLNSAIGSGAARFRTIVIIASVGVLIGAVFSNGMMEVARKGIFNPGFFSFEEIMVIFLAVMMTDILLLDFFNTVSLPTSTTVSIVFELLGAAVAVSLFKMVRMTGGDANIGDYINTESAMIIILGIFLSVIIAFTMGMVVQWIVRLGFSFRLEKTSRYLSGIWGGFAITAILYFLLIKGAKGSSLVTGDMLAYLRVHTGSILLISFVGWSVVLQLLVSFTKINILRVIVLIGTFSLAMAFAGNDLVNFIGVPMAGYESFRAFTASGGADPSGFTMEALRAPISTPIYFLIAAGLIMVLALRFSKKAHSVTATEINLSRQDEGKERFASSMLARFLVRRSVEFSNGVSRITPRAVSRFVTSRFREDSGEEADTRKKKTAFDLVRASVNLVVASILIAIGTSLKLPLSTTFVTFSVAMGTSLSDGAWGRESAVYRITGVLTVFGGWLFTAASAFTASFIIASLIFLGRLPVILVLIGLSIFILLRTYAIHRKRRMKEEEEVSEAVTTSEAVLQSCQEEVKSIVIRAAKVHYLTYLNLQKEKYKQIKKLRKEVKQLTREVKEIKEHIPKKLDKFKESEIEVSHHYVQVIDYLKEMANSLMHIVLPAYNHLDNNHSMDKYQREVISEFNEKTSEFFNYVINLLKKKSTDNMEEVVRLRDELLEMINQIIHQRIKLLKKGKKGVKISMTYIEMLTETKNLLLHVVQLTKTNSNLLVSFTPEKQTIEESILD
ncbi:MAG: inorganic phosphate transporter [Bacteroidales bacterium]